MTKIYKGPLQSNRKPWPAWISPLTVLTTTQAAEFLGVDRRTLQRWRQAGIGPSQIPFETTQWEVAWHQAYELIQWREQQLGLPVPSLDALMQQHVAFMAACGIKPVLKAHSLSPRPYQAVERWRVKGLRKRWRGRSQALSRYHERR